jgi:ABC-type amino acid transport substrate-binding protein
MGCGRQCVRAAQLGAVLLMAACSGASPPPPPASDPGAASTQSPPPGAAAAGSRSAADDELPPVPSPYDALPESARAELDRPFVGDLDQMVKRRLIRAGVVFNRTQYFIDGGTQRGLVYESIRLFEEQLNKRLKTKALPVHVAFVPLARDQLFPALLEGKVDLAAAALTITPEREKLVQFSHPTRTDVSEIAVTPKGTPPMRPRQTCLAGKSTCGPAAATTRVSCV